MSKPNEEDIYLAKEKFTVILSNFLSNKFNRTINTRWRNGTIELNVDNQYYFDIDKGNNQINLAGIISGLEFENLVIFSVDSSEIITKVTLASSSSFALLKAGNSLMHGAHQVAQ